VLVCLGATIGAIVRSGALSTFPPPRAARLFSWTVWIGVYSQILNTGYARRHSS
jgi:hypothetical protein